MARAPAASSATIATFIAAGLRLAQRFALGCLGPSAAASRARRRGRDLVLAVRAHPPRRVERARAVRAWVLELAQAARAPEEVLLDRLVAVRAEAGGQLVEPGLGGLHLELALAHVVEVL